MYYIRVRNSETDGCKETDDGRRVFLLGRIPLEIGSAKFSLLGIYLAERKQRERSREVDKRVKEAFWFKPLDIPLLIEPITP